MKLSVIVPVFNGALYIERCISSLYQQGLSEKDFELIVINDGSTDETPALLDKFREIHPNIRIVNQPNSGQGAARNKGIQLAKGEYIYFLDADDYLASGAIGPLLEVAFKLHLEVLGFKTKVTQTADLKNSDTSMSLNDVNVITGQEYMITHKAHRFEVWWYLIKREFLLSSGIRFEEGKYLEDAMFTLNILLRTERLVYVPEDVHRYVKLSTSTMNSDDPQHLEIIINAYKTLVIRLSDLIKECSKGEYPERIIDHLRYVRTVTVYFMFFKLIRSRLGLEDIGVILRNFRKIGAYPFTGLIGSQFNHPKIKVSAFIFNRSWLFYTLLYPIRVLLRINFIRLPM